MLPHWAKHQRDLQSAVIGLLCAVRHAFLHRVAGNHLKDAKQAGVAELSHHYIKTDLVGGIAKNTTVLDKVLRGVSVQSAKEPIAGFLALVNNKNGVAVTHLPDVGHFQLDGEHLLHLLHRAINLGVFCGDLNDLLTRQLLLIAVNHFHVIPSNNAAE